MSTSYDVWLVLLSYLVACYAAYTTLGLAPRVSRPDGSLARGWMAAGALAMGLGVWAMHFIGMLALHLPVRLSYDLTITLLSILPAVAASAIVLVLMRRPVVSRGLHLAGAVAMGVGIGAMHYSGMQAIRMQPDLSYHPALVALSVAIAVGASWLALAIALRARARASARARGAAALVMGAAIVAMHYSGMAATDFAEGSVCISPPLGVEPLWLAVMVGLGSCVLLFATLLASLLDVRRLERLRRSDAQMLERATALATTLAADARASEAHKRAIVEASLDAVVTIDAQGRIVDFNPAAVAIFGYARDEVLGWPLSQCIVPPDLRERHERGFARVMAGGPSHLLGKRIEIRAMRKGGAEFPVELALTRTPIRGEPAFTAHLRDLTERQAAEQSLQLRSVALDTVDNGICIVDAQGRIDYSNPAFAEIVGRAALVGRDFGWLFAEGRDGQPRIPRALRAAVARGGLPLRRMRYRKPDGREIWCDVVVKMLRDTAGMVTHSVAVVSDVTDAVLHEQQLSKLANFDALTGLPNRANFRRQLEQRLARDRDRAMSLFFVDLDEFKQVNDRHGHECGDALLVVLGQRLKACVRDGDLVARLGGDEFVMMVEARGLACEMVERALIERVLHSIGQPIHLDGRLLHASCSIGVSRFPDEGMDADTLLRKADQAMYAAKREGGRPALLN
ncbi:bifunctional diguanylate cyclase/phosphodiesterase [Pelomonas sp. KK5]|uniref:sensor domain-containing diguanylate cyclase n=1 Tax=Pelomonas sp. KK5 TaxID=1855730 RepID=UPI00097C3B8E|nr:diguanylate cyclase [Pelomonas sp. KK5]